VHLNGAQAINSQDLGPVSLKIRTQRACARAHFSVPGMVIPGEAMGGRDVRPYVFMERRRGNG
jgi:hypothetical protein